MNVNPEFFVSKMSRVFRAGAYEMGDVYNFISDVMANVSANGKDVAVLEMVADEIFTNIMNYAYEREKCADKWVTLEISLDGEAVTMAFIDGGRPFDPLATPTPDITLSADEREIGGLGIHIMRSVMDDVSYLRDGDKNILTTRKKINRESQALHKGAGIVDTRTKN